MEKQRKTIYINAEIFKKFQILAIELGTSVSKLIEEFMQKKIEEEK